MMQKYKNKKTGAIIDATSLMGGDWELYKAQQNNSLKADEEQQENVVFNDEEGEQSNTNEIVEKLEETTDNVPEEITKPQIMQELDAFGVKYNPRDKKQVLYDLMIAQGK